MVSCPRYDVITEAAWRSLGRAAPASVAGRAAPHPAPGAPAPVPLQSGPDALTRIAEEMAAETARLGLGLGLDLDLGLGLGLDRDHGPQRSRADAGAALVTGVRKAAGRCHGCRQWQVLRFIVLRPMPGAVSSVTERWLLCPCCLSVVPHKLLF